MKVQLQTIAQFERGALHSVNLAKMYQLSQEEKPLRAPANRNRQMSLMKTASWTLEPPRMLSPLALQLDEPASHSLIRRGQVGLVKGLGSPTSPKVPQLMLYSPTQRKNTESAQRILPLPKKIYSVFKTK